MHLIEPCCAPKHLLALRSKLGKDGTAFFEGYGDLSLAELLPPLLTRYSEVEMTIVAPALPNAAAAAVRRAMERQLMSIDGKRRLNAVSRLTLITDLREHRSRAASQWLADNPFGSRLVLHDVQQNDTAILLPDIAFFGNINLTYGGHFTALATKNAKVIANLRRHYAELVGGQHR